MLQPDPTIPPTSAFSSPESLLAALINSSDDAIVSKDLNGVVMSWNKGAERIFGFTAAEMVGQPITRIIPAERQSEETEILSRLRRGERIDHFETVRQRKDGTPVEVALTISPVRNAEGQIVGASKIARDVTEQHRAAEELRRVAAEEARQSRIKDEFLATLSHELRTPLQSIVGWIQILREPDVTKEDLEQGLEVIDRNAKGQTRIIEDLLDMSRILTGKVRLDVQQVMLGSVIEAAVETVKPAAHAKEIRLHAMIDPLAKPVTGDPSRLQQVFWNMLSNAIKFTPRGGRVQVLLERVNSHLEVTVTDTGAGIAPEFLPYVFERFRQADASTTRKHAGLGLGLAIVKHLVELHGGTVRAKSSGLGEGASFTATFPLAVLHPETENVTKHSRRERPSTPLPTSRLDGVSVLVVDDEEDARVMLAKVLQKAGANVRTASSAAEALAAFQSSVPTVLVSDIGMPEEDGFALIKAVRALPPSNGGQVPAIALTAYTRMEDRVQVFSSGFQMHLAKPAESKELLAVVESLARQNQSTGS